MWVSILLLAVLGPQSPNPQTLPHTEAEKTLGRQLGLQPSEEHREGGEVSRVAEVWAQCLLFLSGSVSGTGSILGVWCIPG